MQVKSFPRNPNEIPPESIDINLEDQSKVGEIHRITVRGTSMLPLIRDGDVLVVTFSDEKLRRGDVVLFRQGNELLAHRALNLANRTNLLLTKGDHLLQSDPKRSREQILGKVIAVERGARKIDLQTLDMRWTSLLIAESMLVELAIYNLGLRLQQWIFGQRTVAISRLIGVLLCMLNFMLLSKVDAIYCRDK